MQFLRRADTLAAMRAAYLLNVMVTVILVIAGVHDFALGPAASRIEAGSNAAETVRRRAAWLARVNALVGIILLVAAVRLARG